MFKIKYLAIIAALCCGGVHAQTQEELLRNNNTDNVLNFGMGYDLQMWSPLNKINKSNVKRLVPVWSFSTATTSGELSQPTVYNGVMYVVSAEFTFAIDVASGREIWRTPTNFTPSTRRSRSERSSVPSSVTPR